MVTFKTVVLWLHLTAAVIWIGGMFFMAFVLLPMLQRSMSSTGELSETIERTVKRFQTISWEAVGFIFLTGIFNLINAELVGGFNFTTAYLRTVATKLFLLVLIFSVQSYQSYRLWPKLVPASSDHQLPASTDSFVRLRNKIILLSIFNLSLAGAAIYLGLGLKSQ